jgi:hypothetical protein
MSPIRSILSALTNAVVQAVPPHARHDDHFPATGWSYLHMIITARPHGRNQIRPTAP